jgi:hypothetical protein
MTPLHVEVDNPLEVSRKSDFGSSLGREDTFEARPGLSWDRQMTDLLFWLQLNYDIGHNPSRAAPKSAPLSCHCWCAVD